LIIAKVRLAGGSALILSGWVLHSQITCHINDRSALTTCGRSWGTKARFASLSVEKCIWRPLTQLSSIFGVVFLHAMLEIVEGIIWVMIGADHVELTIKIWKASERLFKQRSAGSLERKLGVSNAREAYPTFLRSTAGLIYRFTGTNSSLITCTTIALSVIWAFPARQEICPEIAWVSTICYSVLPLHDWSFKWTRTRLELKGRINPRVIIAQMTHLLWVLALSKSYPCNRLGTAVSEADVIPQVVITNELWISGACESGKDDTAG
jgi:hypothetical protein